MAKRKTIAVPPQTRAMLARVVAKLKPPPTMTLSQWADKERRLSQGASALPGRWRTDKAPYQRGMMDAISDPHVRKVVVKSCAQIGKTDALVLNTIGYYMNYNPSPIMVLQPTLDMGIEFVGQRVWATHAVLRKSTARRMKREVRKISEDVRDGVITRQEYERRVASIRGMMDHTNSGALRWRLNEITRNIVGEEYGQLPYGRGDSDRKAVRGGGAAKRDHPRAA